VAITCEPFLPKISSKPTKHSMALNDSAVSGSSLVTETTAFRQATTKLETKSLEDIAQEWPACQIAAIEPLRATCAKTHNAFRNSGSLEYVSSIAGDWLTISSNPEA
jgi:hypothetical protein